jgi:hypothetical protein
MNESMNRLEFKISNCMKIMYYYNVHSMRKIIHRTKRSIVNLKIQKLLTIIAHNTVLLLVIRKEQADYKI